MKTTCTVLVMLAFVVGCDHGRSDVVPVAEREAAAIVSETYNLWLTHRDRLDHEIPPAQYPPSVRALQPKRVSADKHGIFIETYARYVESAGVFVRHDHAYEPPRSGDPGFESIAPNVYWYFAPG